MRLKVSPKAALEAVDRLIYEGFKLERAHAETLKSAHSAMRMTAKNQKEIDDWYNKTVKTLRAVFIDFAPVYSFWKAIEKEKDGKKKDLYLLTSRRDPQDYARMLNGGLRVLGEYYRQLSEEVFTPLFYIPDKAQICFFASICPLEPDSNEDAVCRFLFKKYSYHEWVEMEDIVIGAFGGNKDEYSTQDKAKVENAYDGVNRKTNEAFGFPVLKKRKALIALNLPSRFLREERQEMA